VFHSIHPNIELPHTSGFDYKDDKPAPPPESLGKFSTANTCPKCSDSLANRHGGAIREV